MDGFSIIQNFFTRMRCHFCSSHLEPDGIQLIRHEKGVYIVNVHCLQCTRQMGIALVGLEGTEISEDMGIRYDDPELTPDELERLASFEPIGYDDVLDAHAFFSGLGPDWQQHLPTEMLQLDTESPLESEAG